MNYTEAFFDELEKIAIDWSIAIPAAAGAGLGGVGGYYGAKRLGAGKGGRIAGGVLGGVAGGALGAGGSLAFQPEKAQALLDKIQGGKGPSAARMSKGSISKRPVSVSVPKKAPDVMGPPAPSPSAPVIKPEAASGIRWKPSGSKTWKTHTPKSVPVKPTAETGVSHMKWKPSGSKTWNVGKNPVTLSKSEVGIYEAMKNPKYRQLMQEAAAEANAKREQLAGGLF